MSATTSAAGGGSSALVLLADRVIASCALEILACEPALRLGSDPEAVHLYRVAVRRLRSNLRTFRQVLDHSSIDALRDELGWVGRAVGEVRDLDVLASRLALDAAALSDVDAPAGAALVARAAQRRTVAHGQMLDVLDSHRYEQLRSSLAAIASAQVAAPGDRGAGSSAGAARATRLVRRRWRRLAAVVRDAGDDPSDQQLHEIRIEAKRCRYAAEALAPIMGRPARRFAAGVEKVQGVLGEHHDTVVVEQWLRDAAIDLIDCRVAIGGLIAVERLERARLRAAWPAAWRRAARRKAAVLG